MGSGVREGPKSRRRPGVSGLKIGRLGAGKVEFTTTELAVYLGVTENAVRNAVATGRITPNAAGLFDPKTAARDWNANRRGQPGPGRPRRPRGGDSGAEGTLIEAQTRDTVLKAEEREIRLARMRRELVDRPLAERKVYELATLERDSWRTWPLDAAERLAADLGLTDVGLVRRVLEQHVAARLGSLREITVRLE